MDKCLFSVEKRLKHRVERKKNDQHFVCERRKRKLEELYCVAHPSAYFPTLSSDYITSIISFMIRFAQATRGYISRCASTWASNKPAADRFCLQSRHPNTMRRERDNLAGRNDTRPVLSLSLCLAYMYLRRIAGEKGKKSEKNRGKNEEKKEKKREKQLVVVCERRNPVNEAEGREAEKRNDDETRSHYYIHIQARWGEPSPSFCALLSPSFSLSRSFASRGSSSSTGYSRKALARVEEAV